ncbi:MAG TPA: histidine kinase, partial [Chitinophagaceae bacterium]
NGYWNSVVLNDLPSEIFATGFIMINSSINKILFVLVFFATSFSGLSQSPVPQLQDSLSKVTSAKGKADICFAISSWYSDRLRIDSGLFYANKIKELSEPAGYETGIGKYHLASSLALRYRGRNAEAEENVLKAIEIFTRQKEILFLGRSYWQLAAIQYAVNRIIESRKNYWTSINYLVSAKDQSGCFRAYYLLARTYIKTAETDSAAYYYIKALEMAEQLKDDKRISETACEVGECYLSQREFEKANRYLSYGLKKRTSLNDKVAIRISLDHYSTSLILLHDFSRADSIIREFELINVTLNDAWGKITLNRIKGLFEYEQKNYHKALSYLYQANNNIGGSNIPDADQKEVVFLLGKAEFETQDYDNAIMHLQTAGKLAHELRYMFDEMETDFLLSKAFEKKGKPDSALYYFRNYSLLKDSVLTVQKQKNIIEITTRYETGKKEQEIKILQKEGEANSYMLRLQDQQIEKQQLEDEKRSQEMDLISKQNEINKLDVSQKTLSLDNEKKENEKKQVRMESLEKESALQTTIARSQEQRKNFAYGLIASILIFSGYGYYRYRQNKKLSSQLSHSLAELRQAQAQLIKFEKEKESENIRVRISRDIHDEVGATLSGVALFSEIAKQKMDQHNEPDAKIYLDHISANSKDMVEKMGDIVWTINPENVSIDRIVARLKAYAVNLCGGKGIQIHFQVDEAIKDFFPDMPERKNIYLFSKEAINNAVKYSNGSNIFFSILKSNNKVALEIKDDGIGFDTNSIVKGNGLINMQTRAKELNAILAILSKPGKGTC